MPTGYRKKPLGAWPDDKKHEEIEKSEGEDNGEIGSHDSDPEKIEDKDTLERAKEAGLYDEYNNHKEGEVSVADEEKEDIDNEHQS